MLFRSVSQSRYVLTWTKDDLGNNKSVLNFDGSTNYISLTDNDAWYFGTGDFSISFWVKITYFPSSAWLTIIGQKTSYDSNASWVITYQTYNNSSVDSFLLSTYGDGVTQDIDYWRISQASLLNTWAHIVIVKTGTTAKLYRDGTLISAVENALSSNIYNSTAPLIIGASSYSGTYNNFLYGQLKDLMIWKGRVLTQAEIKLLMNRTHPITGRGLIDSGKYWRLS